MIEDGHRVWQAMLRNREGRFWKGVDREVFAACQYALISTRYTLWQKIGPDEKVSPRRHGDAEISRLNPAPHRSAESHSQ
jgi:hypothetical protein